MTAPDLHELVAGLTRYPVLTAGVVAVILIAVLLRWRSRAAVPAQDRSERRWRSDDLLTLVVAGLATGMSAQGMWRFFGDVLAMPWPLRIAMFGVFELAMLTSALRARANVADGRIGTAGVDGVAVWAMAALSAVLSATDAWPSFGGILARLSAPLVAAWLWERGLSIERRRAGRNTIHWRITPERILVRLGVAEGSDRTATEVDAHRRLARLTRAAHAVRRLRAEGARPGKVRRAERRLDAAMDAAVEHAGLAADPGRQEALLAQLGARYHAAALVDLTPVVPWMSATDDAAAGDRTGEARTGSGERDRTGPRTAVSADIPKPVRADGRTGVRTGASGDRTAKANGVARTVPRKTGHVDRQAVVAELAAEFREFVAHGRDGRWVPDWDAWMARTGRSKSFFEKCARQARERVFDAEDRTADTERDRTGIADADRTSAGDDRAEQDRTTPRADVRADDRTAVDEDAATHERPPSTGTGDERTDDVLAGAGDRS